MRCRHVLLTWLLMNGILILSVGVSSAPPPVQKETTIVLYTDTKTWNEAKLVCESQGQTLLDITYYSLFVTVHNMALVSPWNNVPVGNGPPKWIGLHRRVTPLGDEFYSLDCQKLTDFKIQYWGKFSPYIPDGFSNTFCVYHQTSVNLVSSNFVASTDYTKGDCSEKHQFYCQKEGGPCPFDKLTDHHGLTDADIFPGNDIYLPYVSDDSCKNSCFQESISTEMGNTITEECWGFTTTATECILHLVVDPTFFDNGNHYPSSGDNLYIKRCFSTDVDNIVHDVGIHESFYPDSTCGTPVMENSTLSLSDVFVYPGTFTWNEGFQTCESYGQALLNIKHEDVYPALQKLIAKYPALTATGAIWLGYHKPEPKSYTNIRVWSDCSTSTELSNWDPDFQPGIDVMDDLLCAVLDTSSLKWKPVKCQESHSLLCVQINTGNTAYDTGTGFTVGTGMSLGPYIYDYTACRDACTKWAYEGQDCRAFAHRYTSGDDVCNLYFADTFTFYEANVQTTAEDFTFYRKLFWTDHEMTSAPVLNDDSLYPYSCCDLSVVDNTPKCPSIISEVPTRDTNIPTTTKTKFILHVVPKTWNEANTVCKDSGGQLVRVDGVSKRYALAFYISSWISDGYVNSVDMLWSGLILADHQDNCTYRWPNVCSAPDWITFQTGSGTPSSSPVCGAMDTDVDHVMRQCNENLPYICEVITSDPCAMDLTILSTNCILEAAGDYSEHTMGTCDELCLTASQGNKECWTTIDMYDMSICVLVYYVDPYFCQVNKTYFLGRVANFKICYGDQVVTSDVAVTTDNSLEPNSDCFQPFTYSYSRDAGRCQHTTSTTTATTTTLTTTSITTTTTAVATTTGTVTITTTTVPTTTTPPTTSTLSTAPTTTDTTTTTPTLTSSASTVAPTLVTSTSSSPSSITAETSTATSTATTESSTTEPRSSPTNIQTVVPISVAASIVVPLKSLPQTVQDKNLTEPVFLWPCTCNTDSENKMTVEEWSEWFSKTQSIEKNRTSKYKRRLSSAKDDRPSTISIGIVAAITLAIFGAIIILLDVSKILRDIRGKFE